MTLKELQDILFEILCTVDDICTREGIDYSLEGGTLLGAVRHKGFIPWDDDVDISINQKDLPRFRDAMYKYLPDYYQFITPADISPNFFDFVCRVQDTRHLWHAPTDTDVEYHNLQNYVCVDVFLITNSANHKITAKIYSIEQLFLYGLAMGHRTFPSQEKASPIKKCVASALTFVGKFISMKKILTWKEKLDARNWNAATQYSLFSNDLPKYIGLPYRTEWFGAKTRLPFRERMLMVHQHYHDILSIQYGNYMEPPKDLNEYIQHSEMGQSNYFSMNENGSALPK